MSNIFYGFVGLSKRDAKEKEGGSMPYWLK